MEVWYLSYDRFENRVIRKWNKKGFNWNKSHLNLLHYAFRTSLFWCIVKNKGKISQKNQIIAHPKLF